MNKHSMIAEAKEYIKRAADYIRHAEREEFIRAYGVADYLIEKLERVYDYDFIDENPDYCTEYSFIVSAYCDITLN